MPPPIFAVFPLNMLFDIVTLVHSYKQRAPPFNKDQLSTKSL